MTSFSSRHRPMRSRVPARSSSTKWKALRSSTFRSSSKPGRVITGWTRSEFVMAQLLEDFKNLTNDLNKQGIDYAVCGGWAMAIHGFLRATLDIGIMILTDDLARVQAILRRNGYDLEGLPLNFDGGRTQIRRISK